MGNNVSLKRGNGIAQTVNDFVQSSKDFITEAALSDLFPNLLNGIHFRGVGGDVKEDDIFREFQELGFVPCGPVTAEQHDIIRKLTRQFLQKQIHAHRIAVGHNKKAGFARKRLHRSISISILPNMVTGHTGAYPFFAPAVFGLVDSSKSRFILKHQPYLSTISTAIVDFFVQFLDFCFNFFEVSMTSSLAFFGCRLRGITFRHPCRFNTR